MLSNYEKALQYVDDIQTGKIASCIYVKNACQRFLNDLENPNYYYSPLEVDAVIRFINKLNL